MNGSKGVFVLGGAILVSIWISILVGLLAIKSEAKALITTAQMIDTTVAQHVSVRRGYGGLGRYLVVRLTGSPEEVLGRCPWSDENVICMKLDVRTVEREPSCPGVVRNGTCRRSE